MTAELVARVAAEGVFRPRGQFRQLAGDHVPLDGLTGRDAYEAVAHSALVADEPVVVLGPRGGGKSSLLAWVCDRLPDTHVALRVPVTGADDPTSVSTVAAVALSQALDDLDLERYQAEALERARADEGSRAQAPVGFTGGTLGGGPVPAAVHVELGSMRDELTMNRLASERLAGLDRLITILVARGVRPVFVLEDTEAAVGGAERRDTAEAFLAGPVQAFLSELDAPCFVAVQTSFTETDAFARIAATVRLVELPALDDETARRALDAIVANRLQREELPTMDPRAILAEPALDQLVTFYEETERNLRFTLAALQTSAEHAADMRAERIAASHVRTALVDWRGRMTS